MNKVRLIFLLCIFSATCFSQKKELRIIVFDFQVLSPALSMNEGVIIAEAIRAKLQKTVIDTNVKVLERSQVAKLYKDRGDASKLPGIYDTGSAMHFGRLLEANYVLIGKVSQSAVFDGTMISANIVEIETGVIKSSGDKLIDSKANFDNIITGIVTSLEEGLELNHIKPNPKKTGFLENIKSVLDIYMTKFSDKDCRVHGNHRQGDKNGIVYYPNDVYFPEYKQEMMSSGYLNPSSAIIGIIHDKVYGKYEKEETIFDLIDNDDLRPFDQVKNNITFLINEDGIYWKFDLGTSPCDCEFYAKREKTVQSGGLDWSQLYAADIQIKDTIIQNKVRGNLLGKSAKKELRDDVLIINGEVLAGRAELAASCLNIYELKNLLTQLKSIKF